MNDKNSPLHFFTSSTYFTKTSCINFPSCCSCRETYRLIVQVRVQSLHPSLSARALTAMCTKACRSILGIRIPMRYMYMFSRQMAYFDTTVSRRDAHRELMSPKSFYVHHQFCFRGDVDTGIAMDVIPVPPKL